MSRRLALALGVVVLAAACSRSPSSAPEVGTWHARLRIALFERVARDGSRWGRDRLDPYLNRQTDHLLAGPSHEAAIAALDAFVADLDRGLALSTRERALIQRDLFAVHDWALEPIVSAEREIDHASEREALARRVAIAMARIALEPHEIDGLPDPVAATGSRDATPSDWDRSRPTRPYLPRGFGDPKGAWVCLGDTQGRPLAPAHRFDTLGHASFSVFVRLPGERRATEDWIARVETIVAPHAGEDDMPAGASIPEPPPLTQFAVVRRAMLVDRGGRPRVSPIVERIELRVHGADATVPGIGETRVAGQPASFEWSLDGARWLRDDPDPLVAIGSRDLDFVFFGDLHFDPFGAREGDVSSKPPSALGSCLACHGAHLGVHAIRSATHAVGSAGGVVAVLRPSTPAAEAEADVKWKAGRSDFARLTAAFRR